MRKSVLGLYISLILIILIPFALAESPRIKITQPSIPSDKVFTVGVAKTIEWQITGDASAISAYKILYFHKGLSQWIEIASGINAEVTSYSITLPNDGFSGAAFIAVYASNVNGKKVTYSYIKVSAVKPKVKIGSEFKSITAAAGSTVEIPLSFTGDQTGIKTMNILYWHQGKSEWKTLAKDIIPGAAVQVVIPEDGFSGKSYMAVIAYNEAGKKLSTSTSVFTAQSDCTKTDLYDVLKPGSCRDADGRYSDNCSQEQGYLVEYRCISGKCDAELYKCSLQGSNFICYYNKCMARSGTMYGTIKGIVKDGPSPVTGARIEIPSIQSSYTTDSTGTYNFEIPFELSEQPQKQIALKATAINYADSQMTATVNLGGTAILDFEMQDSGGTPDGCTGTGANRGCDGSSLLCTKCSVSGSLISYCSCTTSECEVLASCPTGTSCNTATSQCVGAGGSCVDSDGGLNYLEAGNCASQSLSDYDACLTTNSLKEFSCGTGDTCVSVVKPCSELGASYACSNGACVNTGVNLGTLTGTVYKQSTPTNTPLQSAAVQIKMETSIIAEVTTNANGKYTKEGLPVGSYTVSAKKYLFTEVSYANVNIVAGTTTTRDFVLVQDCTKTPNSPGSHPDWAARFLAQECNGLNGRNIDTCKNGNQDIEEFACNATDTCISSVMTCIYNPTIGGVQRNFGGNCVTKSGKGECCSISNKDCGTFTDTDGVIKTVNCCSGTCTNKINGIGKC